MDRRIVCAANKWDDGTIIIGVRHWDKFMHKQADAYGISSKKHEQGFIDQYGVFMTREEALELALKNGQRIRRCGGDSKELYSENLY